MERPGHDTKLATEWCENNFTKLNEVRCDLLVTGYRCETLCPKIGKQGMGKQE